MNTKFFLTFFLLYSVGSISLAQDLAVNTYKWDDSPSYQTDKNKDIETIKKQEIIEYTFQGNVFTEFYLRHKIEFINSHEKIELSNKKYISFSEGDEITKHKARVIQPDGSINELDDSMFMEAVDEQSGRKQKYFAFEGVQFGSIIEYLYVVKRKPSYSGNLIFFQYDYPVREYRFDLYAPVNLIFDFKVTNDTNSVTLDTLYSQNINHWTLQVNNIPELKDEQFAPYNQYRKQFAYKLDKNTSNSANDITSYGKIGQSVYERIYEEQSGEAGALKSFMKKAKITKNADTEKKIRAIENYCKRNIQIVEYSAPQLSDIKSIVKNKTAGEYGMLRLLAKAFKAAGINHQIVLTNDRSDFLFDKDFDAYHNLKDYLIYFPDIDMYLNPDDAAYRLGIIPFQNTDNYGLFIKEFTLGDFTTGLAQTGYIKLLPYDKSMRNLTVKAKLYPDQNTELKMSNVMSGYNALYLQHAYEIISDDKKEQLAADNLKGILESLEIKSWNVENGNSDLFGQKPFVVNGEGSSSDLIEHAGNKLLFKIGELIGPQMEMYNDTARQLPIHGYFKRSYKHELEIEIPENYFIKNPDDLNISEKYDKDGKTLIQFVSVYTLKDNKLKVTINEFYDKIFFPLDEVDDYRRVVNGASDFNKVVLVLEPKN